MVDDRRTAEDTLGQLMEQFVSSRVTAEVSEGRRATAVWLAANGDVERSHTTGVYLRAARVRGQAPVLGVYLDSRMRVVDFSANKDLYVARVINQGLEISDIEFKLDRQGRKPLASMPSVSSEKVGESEVQLPELTDEETARVDELTRNLPESFREVAQKAVVFSLRREKVSKTEK